MAKKLIIPIAINENKIVNRQVIFKQFCNHTMAIVKYDYNEYLVDLEFYKKGDILKLGKCLGPYKDKKEVIR